MRARIELRLRKDIARPKHSECRGYVQILGCQLLAEVSAEDYAAANQMVS